VVLAPAHRRGAVCSLSTSDTATHPTELSLLITPSIGCSDTYRFHIDKGRLVAG
jgi:hypothetical protein